MDEKRFEELLTGIDEMKSHQRGEETEMCVTFRDEPDPREIRRNMGLSQKDFAYVLGIDLQKLQEWEQGRRDPKGAAVKLLHIAANRPEVLLEMA